MVGTGELFHFDEDRPSFESIAKQNGETHWFERQLVDIFGYESRDSFRRVIRKAMQTCLTLGIATEDNFHRTTVIVDGAPTDEYELTRFACYLIAMQGDARKPAIAAAQAYFATLAEQFQRISQDPENVERVLLRAELKDGMKGLAGVAQSHGVENMAYFHNAGYRGMYNMNLRAIEQRKGIPAGKLLDRIGREELAANLFRVTQTEAKIRAEDLRGQRELESAAEAVGHRVRMTMQELSGTSPEDLEARDDVKAIEGDLKKTSKGFRRLGSAAKRKRLSTNDT